MSKNRKNSIKRYSVLLFIFIILSILFILPLFKWHYLPFGDDMDFNVDRVLELKYNFLHFNFYPLSVWRKGITNSIASSKGIALCH